MKVRYAEGWLAHLVAGQPWATKVETFSATTGPTPFGLKVSVGSGKPVMMRLAGGCSPSECADTYDQAGPVTTDQVQAPADPVGLAAAVVTLIERAGHEQVKTAETYAAWGKTSKPAGIRLVLADGEIFGTVLDGKH